MDDESRREPAAPQGAFAFTGNWQEFAPIAFTNLLLTIVTLGIYTFWARTRVRRYLWSRTRFIDDRLEWTGTGLELFIGYLLAFVFIILPIGGINLVLQGVVLHGHPGLAAALFIGVYLLVLYLFGIAIFRALRYRLSRTFWHGIRGGSDTQGLAFGWQYLWRTIAGSLTLGLLIPWSMTSLWNERWSEMSFGPLRFNSEATASPIILRFLVYYLVPVLIVIAVFVIGFFGAAIFGATGIQTLDKGPADVPTIAFIVLFALGFYVLFFGVLGAVALFYYSAYFREVVGNMTLGELEFEFTARTWDWMKLFLGSIGLVMITFGIGYIFVPYRNWAFFIRHMRAFGEIKLDELTQSDTRDPGQGEGLLDAFDIGAF